MRTRGDDLMFEKRMTQKKRRQRIRSSGALESWGAKRKVLKSEQKEISKPDSRPWSSFITTAESFACSVAGLCQFPPL